MKAKEILDQIEITCKERGLKCENRLILLKHLNFDLTQLIEKEDWDWAQVYLDPVISTQASVREYNLPDNFPEDFLGINFSDGNNDLPMNHMTPARFYRQNLTAESNGRPNNYTVMTRPDGRKMMILSPPPDDEYTISGVYIPTDWKMNDETDLPPSSACSSYLKYSVLARYDVNIYEALKGVELQKLYLKAAKGRKSRIVPCRSERY